MVTSGAFKSILFLLMGVGVGWYAGRHFGGTASNPVPVVDVEQVETVREEIEPQAEVPAARPSVPVPDRSENLPIVERLTRMKIAELRRSCDEAEDRVLEESVSSHARALNDLPAAERDAEVALWGRRFADAAGSGAFWWTSFNIEIGADVVSIEALLDFESNTDGDYRCVSWSLFFEVNGRTSADSLFGSSACEGSGIRKRGEHHMVDVAAYNVPSLGRHLTTILLPLPGDPAPFEYLGASADQWRTVGQGRWQRSSREDFLSRHRRFAQKLGQVNESR